MARAKLKTRKRAEPARTIVLWKVRAIKFLHSYLLAGSAFVLFLTQAVDVASSSTLFPSDEVRMASIEVAKAGVVTLATPWEYFHPTWVKWIGWPTVAEDSAFPLWSMSTPSNIHKYLSDPENRIEDEFAVPGALRSRVKFWAEVYSQVSSKMRIVHDRRDLGKIYGYIDLRPIYRLLSGNLSPATIHAKAAEIESIILKNLKSRLSEAAGLTQTKTLSLDEKNELRSALSRFGASNKEAARSLLANIRTQTGQSDIFVSALFKSRHLLPHIESVFRRNNLPVALARIPFVESSFNVGAASKVGAVGIWQFTPETARQMIHAHDESFWIDPIRQTQSAARLLKLYRNILPDWSTTVTSYNSGIGRIRKLVDKHRVKTAEQLVGLETDELGFAGKNFYAEFLAANIVEAYKEELFEHWASQSEDGAIYSGTNPFPKELCSKNKPRRSGYLNISY